MLALVCLTWSLYFWYFYHLWLYKIIYLFNHIFHTEKFKFIFWASLLYLWSSLLLFMHFQILIFKMRHQIVKNIQPKGTTVTVEYYIFIFSFVPCFFPNSLKPPISYHPQWVSSLKEVGKTCTHSKQHFWELFWKDCSPTCSSLGSPLVDTTWKSVHPTSS